MPLILSPVLGFLLDSVRGWVFSLMCRALTHTRTGQFRYPSVQRYLHDLVSEIGEHIESISSSLSIFIEIGLSWSLAV
jgi:hypothetical protein